MAEQLQIQAGTDRAAQPRSIGGRVPLILVVDDDPDVRALAVDTLRDAGYRVLEAGDGRLAVILFEDHPDIALIVTDIIMPGLDGFKLADMTKFKRPDLKILYTTAYLNEARETIGVVHGAILRKPWRPTQLEAAVKAALT